MTAVNIRVKICKFHSNFRANLHEYFWKHYVIRHEPRLTDREGHRLLADGLLCYDRPKRFVSAALPQKSVQALTFFDEKPEVYNRTSTSGGKVFSQLPQPVIATTRNIEHGPHNPITNRITRLRSNIEHGRRPLRVIKNGADSATERFHSASSNVSRWFTASSASWARDSSSLTLS